MHRYTIPIDLDLRSHPEPAVGPAVEVTLDADLPLLAGHAGHDGPLDLSCLEAALPDGRTVPAQHLPGQPGAVALSLPADAAAGTVRVTLALAAGEGAAAPAAPRVVFSQGPDSAELWVDGSRFAVYRYNTADPELPRPYFHPIMGPTGVPITQDGEIPGTKQAHFHHTGLVLAHQKFTDGNNWQIGPSFTRMRHLAFDVLESGPVQGRFIQRLEWLNAKGDRAVFREARTVTLPARDARARYLDVDTVITCGDQPAVWEATPYHLLAVRPPDAMLVAKGGVITGSEGLTNPKDGTPARWLDYSGPLNGTCGVALFSHPENLRHPAPWLNFQNQTIGWAPTHREPLPWQPGASRRFRLRVYFHAGDVKEGKVAEAYQAYAAAPKARIGPPVRIA